MRITEKIDLIRKLTEYLNSKYDDSDLECFFKHFEAGIEWDCYGNNPEDYSINIKKTLQKIDENVLIQIANELNVGTEHIVIEPPKNWENNNNVKAFISHLAKHSSYAMKLRNALKEYDIDCFVAHEDIRPTEEWQNEITKALNTMDFFISLHMEGFSGSVWCQQEIGYAIARGVKIIPIKIDGKENPEGFIARIQALIKPKTKLAPELAQDVIELLKQDERTVALFDDNVLSEEIMEDEIPF